MRRSLPNRYSLEVTFSNCFIVIVLFLLLCSYHIIIYTIKANSFTITRACFAQYVETVYLYLSYFTQTKTKMF